MFPPASLALGRQRRVVDAAVETEQLMWSLSYSRVATVPTVVVEAVVADDADVVEVARVLLPEGHAAAV
ncbi:MAG: hypothetical protein ACI9OB_000371 [Nonlabens sp.]